MSTLERTTFEVSRAAEYFKPDELEKQTGQPASMFAAVALKELIDNGIDAAETKGIAPEIDITVEVRPPLVSLTVADNGTGLPAETVNRILNFSTRTSDKSAYRAPTRGAQGNALKTVIGIPYALQCEQPVIIEARGVRHTLYSRLDLAGEPRVLRETEPSERQLGTSISLCLPVQQQTLDPERWARGFSLLNPQATVRIRVLGEAGHLANCDQETENSYHATVAFPQEWRKFLPTDLTSAWWYSAPDLALLIGLHNAAAQNGERALTLREFVKQFRGLSGSAKAKQVCDAVPQGTLLDFNEDAPAVALLLERMQAVAQAPSPGVLGRVGEEHFRARFEAWYGVKRFWYRKAEGVAEGVPFLFEVAVAETLAAGELFTGVNFSPTFGDPFAETALSGGEIFYATGVNGFLQRGHAVGTWSAQGPKTAVAVHLICPSLHFLDRGKSRLKVERTMADAIGGALWRAVMDLYREGEQRDKDAARHQRRIDAQDREVKRELRQASWNLKEAVFAVIPQGLEHASGGGESPVSAKTLHYQVRRFIQQYTDKVLDYDYFSQDLLTQYRQEIDDPPGLYYDPRGVLYEPHTGRAVPLGTRAVQDYEFPAWLYNKILYIEKKGLWPPIRHAQIAERYDMAVMASEGYATEAARILFAHANRDQQYRLFVLHDADPDGYEIARTLREATSRMPDYQVEVTDLGLLFGEALDMDLQTEQFTRKKALPARLQLNKRERQAFEGEPFRTAKGKVHWDCTRVELNAFTSPALVAYIERRLQEEGAADKVIPPESVLEKRGRDLHEKTVQDQVVSLVWNTVSQLLNLSALQSKAERIGMAAARADREPLEFRHSRHWVEAAFAKRKTSTWGEEFDREVLARTGTLSRDVEAQVEQYLRERLKELGWQR